MEASALGDCEQYRYLQHVVIEGRWANFDAQGNEVCSANLLCLGQLYSAAFRR